MAEPDEDLTHVIDALKEPVQMSPALTRRVMSEIERLPVPGQRPDPIRWLLDWSRRRWTIRLSPLGALATAASLALLVVAGSLLSGRDGGTVEPTRPTQFVLVAPSAASVAVVGDFNDWSLSATPLARAPGDGVWWVTLPLEPGRYRYSFVLDGTVWRGDPDAPPVEGEDEFGRPTSVVTVGGP